MTRNLLADAIAGLCVWQHSPFFLRVGVQDAESDDTLDTEIRRRGLSGIIVDGAADRLEAIHHLYAGMPGIILQNTAIARFNTEIGMHRFRRAALEIGLLPRHYHGIVSFNMSELLEDDGAIGRQCADAAAREMLRSLVELTNIPCLTFQSLVDKYCIERIDILSIDTCGDGHHILQNMDFKRIRPAIVHVNVGYLTLVQIAEAERLLIEEGYHCRKADGCLLAVPDPAGTSPATHKGLRELAERCLADGWHAEASRLAAHLTALYPTDINGHILAAKAHAAQDKIADAMRDLLAAPGGPGVDEPLAATLVAAAAQAINAHLAAGHLARAAELASLATRLAPGHEGLLSAALLTSASLNRLNMASRFAQDLLILRPDSEAARSLLYMRALSLGDRDTARQHLLVLAFMEPGRLPPHVHLRAIADLLDLDFDPADQETYGTLSEIIGRVAGLAAAQTSDAERREAEMHLARIAARPVP